MVLRRYGSAGVAYHLYDPAAVHAAASGRQKAACGFETVAPADDYRELREVSEGDPVCIRCKQAAGVPGPAAKPGKKKAAGDRRTRKGRPGPATDPAGGSAPVPPPAAPAADG